MVLPDLNCAPPTGEEEEANVNMLQEEEDDDNMLQEEAEATGGPQIRAQRKSMTDEQRYAVYMALHTLNLARGGKFKRNDKKDVAQIFQVGVQHIRKIWTTAERQIALGQEVDVSNRRKGRCGRKGKDDALSKIPTVPLNRRSTLRSLARQLAVSHSTLYKKLKLRRIRRHSNRLKPSLKEKNRRERIKFCLSMLDETTLAADLNSSVCTTLSILTKSGSV